MARRISHQAPDDRDAPGGGAPTPFRSSFRSTIDINANLLMASGCGFVAWTIWPQEPEWWGLGAMSIILWVGAVGGLAKAVRLMAAVYGKDRAMADYMAQGGKPKSSRLATADDLNRAGMLDD